MSKLVRNVPILNSLEMSPSDAAWRCLWKLVENCSVVFQGAVDAF